MKIQLISRNAQMCNFWRQYFENCEDVYIHHGDIFSLETDCIVSPANSFGFMDGGIDMTFSQKIGWQLQDKLQTQIKEKYNGELLVGQAELIETEYDEIPFCISAPTMRVPMILDPENINIYLASKAIFSLVKKEPRIRKISICSLGTGVGRIPYEICAKQMKQAYSDYWLNNFVFPKSWWESSKNHQLLYSDSIRDLQEPL